MGNRVFGCDDCLAVCPWNKFAEASSEAKYASQTGTCNPPISELLSLDDAAFRLRFAGTPVKRTGRNRVVRNALIAAGNSADSKLLPTIRNLLSDASPLVRAMAIWAIQRLASVEEEGRLRSTYLPIETDAVVASEWRHAAGESPT